MSDRYLKPENRLPSQDTPTAPLILYGTDIRKTFARQIEKGEISEETLQSLTLYNAYRVRVAGMPLDTYILVRKAIAALKKEGMEIALVKARDPRGKLGFAVQIGKRPWAIDFPVVGRKAMQYVICHFYPYQPSDSTGQASPILEDAYRAISSNIKSAIKQGATDVALIVPYDIKAQVPASDFKTPILSDEDKKQFLSLISSVPSGSFPMSEKWMEAFVLYQMGNKYSPEYGKMMSDVRAFFARLWRLGGLFDPRSGEAPNLYVKHLASMCEHAFLQFGRPAAIHHSILAVRSGHANRDMSTEGRLKILRLYHEMEPEEMTGEKYAQYVKEISSFNKDAEALEKETPDPLAGLSVDELMARLFLEEKKPSSAPAKGRRKGRGRQGRGRQGRSGQGAQRSGRRGRDVEITVDAPLSLAAMTPKEKADLIPAIQGHIREMLPDLRDAVSAREQGYAQKLVKRARSALERAEKLATDGLADFEDYVRALAQARSALADFNDTVPDPDAVDLDERDKLLGRLRTEVETAVRRAADIPAKFNAQKPGGWPSFGVKIPRAYHQAVYREFHGKTCTVLRPPVIWVFNRSGSRGSPKVLTGKQSLRYYVTRTSTSMNGFCISLKYCRHEGDIGRTILIMHVEWET